MKIIYKLFFDSWPIIDCPQKFPFFSILKDDEQAILIQNTLIKERDIIFSNNIVDFSVLKKYIKNETIVLDYCCDISDANRTIDLPSGWKRTLVEKSVIYENQNTSRHFPTNHRYVIERASAEDIEYMTAVKDSDMRHDYIEQIARVFNDKIWEVYVLKADGQPVCFLALTDSISQRYNLHYKNISMIYTLPQHRRQGLAQYLIRYVLNLYGKDSFFYTADSYLNTASNNLAQSCGFSAIGYNQQVIIELQSRQ